MAFIEGTLVLELETLPEVGYCLFLHQDGTLVTLVQCEETTMSCDLSADFDV